MSVLSPTSVPGFATISPPFRRPINAMNNPMPTAMPFRMLGLIASITASRTLSSVNTRKATPEMNTRPSAVCHALEMPSAPRLMTTDTKKKFSPIPGASAIGYRAYTPMKTDARADATHVATSTAPKSIPVGFPARSVDRTAGWTTMMYAIVRNVVRPARASVRTFVP